METSKIALLGKTLYEIQQITANLGMPKFAAKQIASWIYDKKVDTIDEMTNLSLKHREALKESYEVGASAPVEAMRSVDGTVKYLFRTPTNDYVEAVYIPDNDRATLCVSSQVGCKMNCKFCMTGKQGFTANLTANQILNQIYSIPERNTLTNLVFMGMGEPFDNLDEVLKVLEILTSDYGYKWSPKRITVSSVGLKKGLERFLNESDCHLAISMHSPLPSQRRELMPAEKAFSIEEIVEILSRYDFTKQRRLSFEYIMFKGVNDSLVYAKEIVRLLRGIECRMNLIRFHAIPNVDLEGTGMEHIIAFRDYLTQHGVFATIRASRGEDIFAACGMLSTAKQQEEKKTPSLRDADSIYRLVKAYRNVKMFRSDAQMVCDSLVSNSVDSIIRLYIEPVMWNQANQLAAEQVDVFTSNSKLDKAEFKGDPIMIAEIDTAYYNQVAGRTMTALFKDNAIYRNDVDGNVQTIYFRTETEDSPLVVEMTYLESASASFFIEEQQLVGRSTREAIEQGVMNSVQFELEGYIERLSKKNADLCVIFSSAVPNTTRFILI